MKKIILYFLPLFALFALGLFNFQGMLVIISIIFWIVAISVGTQTTYMKKFFVYWFEINEFVPKKKVKYSKNKLEVGNKVN